MPTEIVHSGSETTHFVYDGQNRRAKKTNGDKSTLYLNKYCEILIEGETEECVKYVFAGNLRITKIDSSGTTWYYQINHLESSTSMTKGSESNADSVFTESLPFGGTREQTDSLTSNYKFTDQELDTETDLYNYDTRLYDPVIGRFITPDSIVPEPFNLQSLNRYSYCLNNPLRYIDPTGRFLEGVPNDGSPESEAFYSDPSTDWSILGGRMLEEGLTMGA